VKLEKQYRTQLLRAAEANKDLDAEWLGVDMKKIDPMHEIMKKVTEEEEDASTIQTSEEPVGFSLADISSKTKGDGVPVVEGEDKSILLSALLGAQKKSIEVPEEPAQIDFQDIPLDPTIPAPSKFLLLLQRMSEIMGKDVPVNDLLTKAEESGMSEDEFEESMNELEKQGIIYRSSKGTVSYVDIEL
jgi:DNA replicative helicase MCM subunit Mcm2 (Cdc46/Mcm family)